MFSSRFFSAWYWSSRYFDARGQGHGPVLNGLMLVTAGQIGATVATSSMDAKMMSTPSMIGSMSEQG